MQKNWPLDLAALALLLSLFFGFKIGERALWAPVEGRYAEIATEMQASGDYVTPRLNGVKYLKKAPLFFWLEAFAVKVFGKSEWVFRAWGAVFAVLGCLAVYIVARNLYGRRAGLLSAIVLATSPLYYALSRTVSLDMTLTFFLAAALMSILWRRREANGLPYAGAILAFYVFAALATLTKGFVGIVMPAIILALWTALIRERRFPKSILLSWGPLWFVAIALPWHVLAAARNPEFWNVYFFQEHIQGYLTMDAEPHNQPWVFLPVLLMSGFPWTVFLVAAIRYHTRPALNEQWRETLLLLLWPAALLVFFSFSSSKVIPYILPMFPALAILIGAYLSFAWERADSWGIRAAGWLVLVGVCLLLGFGLGIPQYYAERHSNWPSLGPPNLDTTIATNGGDPLKVPGLVAYMYVQAAVMIAAALSTLVLIRRRMFGRAVNALAALTALSLVIMNSSLPLLDSKRSVKEFARTIAPLLKPEDEVITFHAYYQDLPVYVGRRVAVASWRGDQFLDGEEDIGGWIIDDETFWQRWKSPATIYVVTSKEAYEGLRRSAPSGIYVIAETNYNVLLTNKETAYLLAAHRVPDADRPRTHSGTAPAAAEEVESR